MQNKKIKILTILSILLFVISIFLLSNNNFSSKKDNSYELENNTYYEVSLIQNNYFSNNKISDYYIANSIKSIDIYFDYYLKNNDNMNYSYDITAVLKSYADNGTKLVWEKEFILDSNKKENQKKLIINKVYNLDYQYYANYVKSFQEYYNIKAENYLYIKLNINIDDSINHYILITIPINNIVDITMEDNTGINTNNENNSINKKEIFIIIIIAIILLIIKNNYKQDSESTLLKHNKDIIMNIKNKPFINSNNIIYLTDLKDLINIAINYNINIFHYQNNYYIIKDNNYYMYNFNKK